MIQKEAPDRAEKRSSLNPAPPAIATMTKKRFDELAEIQSDLLEEIREAGQNWLDRMQSEATLASDFSSEANRFSLHWGHNHGLPGMGETAHGVIHRRRPAPDG